MLEHLETTALVGSASVLGAAAIKGLDCLMVYMKTRNNHGTKKVNGYCTHHPELVTNIHRLNMLAEDTKVDVGEIRKGIEKVSDELFSRVRVAESDIAVLKDRTTRRE